MRTTASISDVKAHLSAYLRRVRRGETIVILQRGKPVARLAPAGAEEAEPEEARLERLERAGVLRRPRVGPTDWAAFLAEHPPVELKPGTSVLDLLLQEREEGW